MDRPRLVAPAAARRGAVSQQLPDVDAVRRASKAFYSALPVLDDSSAMQQVWANTPYVTYVGPQSKSVIVGWEAQKKYWIEFNKLFSQRSVSLVDEHVQVNGNLAWEIGVETGQAQMKDGTTRKVDWIVTNVYEKLGGQWLMVSHHAQPRPKQGHSNASGDIRRGLIIQAGWNRSIRLRCWKMVRADTNAIQVYLAKKYAPNSS